MYSSIEDDGFGQFDNTVHAEYRLHSDPFSIYTQNEFEVLSPIRVFYGLALHTWLRVVIHPVIVTESGCHFALGVDEEYAPITSNGIIIWYRGNTMVYGILRSVNLRCRK